jgi:hypothetical protein
MSDKTCINCKKKLITRHQIRYCSNKCQGNHKYSLFLDNWRNGSVTGVIGQNTKTISAHIKRYLFDKSNNKCNHCGWSKIHPITKNIPLEIDHIDGNAENNSENNLRLLCPNCHSLTPFYRNLNRKNGRKWRMVNYNSNKKAI